MSKKLVAPLVFAGLAALSTAALAATQTATGDVKSTDAAKHELTLSNGETFEVSTHVKLEKFKTGDKVAITYDTKDGKMVASKVHHAK
jgi:Cu/Ag efflux protein CusF